MLSLMAFAKKQEVKESLPFSKYLGLTNAKLVAINPSAEELKKITGHDSQAKEYVKSIKVKDLYGVEKDGKQNAITFWFAIANPKFGTENESESIFVNMPIYLANGCKIGSQSGKIQVIDKWGRTAWVTKDEYDAKSIPMYKNGPANISKNYRAALVGEEELIDTIKALLGTNSTSVRLDDGSYRSLTEEELESRADEFACQLEPEDIKAIMSGNIKPIKSALLETNDVKLILGIRHADNGDYQAVYRKAFKSNFNKLSSIEKEIIESDSNVEYLVEGHIPNGLVEYAVSPTNVTKEKKADIQKPESNDDLPF